MPSDEPQAAASPPPPKVFRWWRDYPLFLFLLLLWVVPLFWRGTIRGKTTFGLKTLMSFELVHQVEKHGRLPKPVRDAMLLPREINHLHNASCLYETSVKAWWTYHVQGTYNERQWFTLRDTQYSPLTNYGRRARIDRLISSSVARGRNKRRGHYRNQAEEICSWYRDRYAELNPTSPPLTAVRIVGIGYRVGDLDVAEPKGRWRKRTPEQVPDRKFGVYHVKSFTEINENDQGTHRGHAGKDEVAHALFNSEEGGAVGSKGEPCCEGL